jgi:hypothetical protein
VTTSQSTNSTVARKAQRAGLLTLTQSEYSRTKPRKEGLEGRTGSEFSSYAEENQYSQLKFRFKSFKRQFLPQFKRVTIHMREKGKEK